MDSDRIRARARRMFQYISAIQLTGSNVGAFTPRFRLAKKSDSWHIGIKLRGSGFEDRSSGSIPQGARAELNSVGSVCGSVSCGVRCKNVRGTRGGR